MMYKEFKFKTKSSAFFITLIIVIMLSAVVLIQFMLPNNFYPTGLMSGLL